MNFPDTVMLALVEFRAGNVHTLPAYSVQHSPDRTRSEPEQSRYEIWPGRWGLL